MALSKKLKLKSKKISKVTLWVFLLFILTLILRAFIFNELILGPHLEITMMVIFFTIFLIEKFFYTRKNKQEKKFIDQATGLALLSCLFLFFASGLVISLSVENWNCSSGEIIESRTSKGAGYATFLPSLGGLPLEITTYVLDPWSWSVPSLGVGSKVSIVHGTSKVGDLVVVKKVMPFESCNIN